MNNVHEGKRREYCTKQFSAHSVARQRIAAGCLVRLSYDPESEKQKKKARFHMNKNRKNDEKMYATDRIENS
jgi:hypothetical protein